MGRETSTRIAGAGDWTVSAPEDRALVDLAGRRHGVVSLADLRALGFSEKAIRHRVGRGWLRRLHSGIYLVGPLTDHLTEPFAAVLASGPTAALSHEAAAQPHGLAKQRRRIDVTVTSGRPRPRGVIVHRASLRDDERTEIQGIPVTSVPRTLIDLGTIWARRDVARAVEQALVLRTTTEAELHEAAASRRPGAKVLRSVLPEAGEASLTRSEAERRLLERVRSAGLPSPITNTKVRGWEVDLLWPRERLVVEVDGYAFHRTRQAFERDRRRDAELQLAGHRVIRITWRQIADEPDVVVATLAAALACTSQERLI